MRKLVCLLFAVVVSLPSFAQESRHLIFHYAFNVRNLTPGEPLELWIPKATSDPFQDVKVLSIAGDLPLDQTREKKFDNPLFHLRIPKIEKNEYHFDITYDVVRRERIGLRQNDPKPVILKASGADQRAYLAADNLVPVTGKLANLAAQQDKGQTTTLAKAHALYDYVFSTMRYDKTGSGWGRGDAEWACDSKRGNCTDFHSVFISMARSQNIPARFSIGFPLPANKHSGAIAGYHCWAEFYDEQNGWVPVDISEAWKDSSKKDYFFGAHDANRIQFSTGRDLVLTPKQSGASLNYLIYPYVEVNGKPWENVENQFSFEDQPTAEQAHR
jgi:hypothetical protein